MQNGTLYTRIVARKLQASNKAVQYILLAGFVPKLVQATAVYFETLGSSGKLTQDVIDAEVAKLVKHSSASGTCDVTKDDVYKKLIKLLENNSYTFL